MAANSECAQIVNKFTKWQINRHKNSAHTLNTITSENLTENMPKALHITPMLSCSCSFYQFYHSDFQCICVTLSVRFVEFYLFGIRVRAITATTTTTAENRWEKTFRFV